MSWPERCVFWVGRHRITRPVRWLFDLPLSIWLTSVVALFAILARLDSALAAMRPPASDGVRVADLSDVGFGIPRAEEATAAVATWARFEGTAPAYTSPRDVVGWYLRIDIAFAALVAVLAGAVLLRRLRRLRVAALQDARVTAERRVISFGLLLVPPYVVADWAEGAFFWRVLTDLWSAGDLGSQPVRTSDWFWFAASASIAKWLLFAAIAAAIAVSVVSAVAMSGAVSGWVEALIAIRVQILFALVLAGGLLFDPTGQVGDTILRWLDEGAHAPAAILGIAWFALLSFAVAWHLLGWPPGNQRLTAPDPFLLIGLAAASFAVALGLDKSRDAGEGLYALALILGLIGVFSLPVRELNAGDPPTVEPTRPLLAPLVAMIPLTVLGVAIVRVAVPPAAATGDRGATALIGTGLAVQLVALLLFLGLRQLAASGGWEFASIEAIRTARQVRTAALIGVTAVGAALWCLIVFYGLAFDDFLGLTRRLGAIGVLGIFLSTAGLVAFLLGALSEAFRPPQAFALARLRRTPVILLVFVWAFLAAQFDKDGAFHDARIRTTTHGWSARSADEALTAWLSRVPEWSGERAAVPLVFVVAEGGGIRAAYWTASVLRCVIEEHAPCEDADNQPPPPQALFAMSGASGGSLGLATYAGKRIVDADGIRVSEGKTLDWVETLAADTLAPTLAWALFIDLPVAFLRKDGGTDRAEVLERAWEDAWPTERSPLGDGFLRTGDRGSVPLLLLNGTKVQEGCRFNNSILDLAVEGPAVHVPSQSRLVDDCLALRLFEQETSSAVGIEPADRALWTLGASEDLTDYLCNGPERREDVRLSTAALLSARFPLISPSGRIVSCRSGGVRDESRAINIVDGGYFDNSASSTVVELWTAVAEGVNKVNRPVNGRRPRPCIVPMLLQIDNHYASVRGLPTSRPGEIGVPTQTLGAGRSAREAQARQAAALLFSRPLPGVKRVEVELKGANGQTRRIEVSRWAHIYPRAHPGTSAPLGWTLSSASRQDLQHELANSNQTELQKVRDWFDASLRCR